jgi:cobalt/nickel transport system permease protein
MTQLAPEFFEPVDSLLHRIDPRWKLAALSVLAAAVAALRTVPCALAAFALTLLLVPLAGIGMRRHLTRLGRVLAILVMVVIWLPLIAPANSGHWSLGPLAISVRGAELAVLVISKTAAILTLVLLLLATASLSAYLCAANSLHVPGFLVHLALLTYRYLFVLAGELAALRVAVRLRAYQNRASLHCYRTIGHLTGTLLVRSSDRAERISHAMRCRAYQGRFHTITETRTRRADVLFFLGAMAAATMLILCDLPRH